MLGIGLGGFASGFGKGYGLGKQIKADWDAGKQKEGVTEALESGKTEYAAGVEAGTDTPNDPNGILRYAMPKIVGQFAKAGDVDSIQKANEWVKSDQAKQGTSFFAAGMLKGQNGDIGGAVKDFVAAGRVQGYGADVEISDPVPTEGGGVSITIKDPKSGKQHVQEFKTPDEVIEFGATYLNPEAAFKQWQATQTAKSSYAADVAKSGDQERAKLGAKTEDEVVRKNLGIGTKSGDMIGARKQATTELQGTDKYEAADEDARDTMISKRAKAILNAEDGEGIGASPKRKIVDTKTGELIEVTE